MTTTDCAFETRIVEAARSGRWPDELRNHVDRCDACGATRAAVSFMDRTAAHLGRDGIAPDPTLIWLKAGLARAAAAQRREHRARLWSQGLAGIAAGATAWAALVWIPPAISLSAETLATSGAAVALVLSILYFAAFRPLRNDGR